MKLKKYKSHYYAICLKIWNFSNDYPKYINEYELFYNVIIFFYAASKFFQNCFQ